MAVTEKKRKKNHHDSSALKIPRLFAEKCCSAVNVMQCKHKFFLSFHSAQGGAGAKGHLGNTHKQMTAKIKVNTTILRHINFTRPVCVNYFFFFNDTNALLSWQQSRMARNFSTGQAATFQTIPAA